MCYKKNHILLVLILSIIYPSLLFAEAGLSEMQRVHRFWVVKPFALSQFEDYPQNTFLFVGYDDTTIFLDPFSAPNNIAVIEQRVEQVKLYGTYNLWLAYGITWDNKWFIATNNYGIKTKIFNDENNWKKEIISLGGPSELQLKTFDEGYRNYCLKQIFWRLIKMLFAIIMISIPWLIILKRYKKQHITRKST